MTAVDNYVEEVVPFPGLVFFSCEGSNDETITVEGLGTVKGAVLTNSDDDEIVTATDITGNVITLGLVDDEGAAGITARAMYGVAWGRM